VVLTTNAAVPLERVRDYGLVTYVLFPINLLFRCRCPLLHWWVRRYAEQLADVLERLFHAAARRWGISLKLGVKASNVTGGHRGPKRKHRAGSPRGAPWRVLLQQTLLCYHVFSSSSVVSRAFSALCMYSKFGHHPHPLGYLCAKFCFVRGLHCWASLWRKIAYLINHSAYLITQEPKLLLRNRKGVVDNNNDDEARVKKTG